MPSDPVAQKTPLSERVGSMWRAWPWWGRFALVCETLVLLPVVGVWAGVFVLRMEPAAAVGIAHILFLAEVSFFFAAAAVPAWENALARFIGLPKRRRRRG